MIHNWFHNTLFGNTIEQYCYSIVILAAGLVLKKYLSKLSSRFIYYFFRKQGKAIGAHKFMDIFTPPIASLFVLGTLYLAFNKLSFPVEWQLAPEHSFGLRMVLHRLFQAALILSFTWLAIRVTEFSGLILIEKAKATPHKTDDQLVPYTKEIVKVVLAAMGILIMLAVAFDLDVVSLVAGLGIGGLAIALAAKESLENLLGSFTIFLDKPFTVGETIKLGTLEGKVESIGFRSTRIRSIDKTRVSVPNKKLVDAELINDTDRTHHRAAFNLSIALATSDLALKNIIADIKAFINAHPLTDSDPIIRFRDIKDQSFDIYIAYIVKTVEYDEYLQVREHINFEILSILKKHQANLAVPMRQLINATTA